MLKHLSADDAAQWLRSLGVERLLTDSRRIRPGDGFLAWPGGTTDSRAFVLRALADGAAACLIEQDGVEAFDLEDARRSALLAQSTLVELQREQVAAWINLYRALGGGFSRGADLAAAASAPVQ